VFSPTRRIYGLAIKALLKPEVLRRMTEVVIKRNLKVIYVQYSMPRRNVDTVHILIFLDLTSSAASIDDIVNDLKASNFVKSVKVIKPLFKGSQLMISSFL